VAAGVVVAKGIDVATLGDHVRELGHRLGDGPVVEPPTQPYGTSDAVSRADLHRERHAALGAEVHPEAALFATRLARAVSEAPERDLVPAVPLPAEPALVHDRDGRVVRANEALAALAGVADPRALAGARMHRLLVGPEADTQLVRADGSRVPVRAARWPLPGVGLTAVVILERDAPPAPVVDPAWVTELERLARIGTWSFDLATSTLERSGTLDELYRAVGVDPDGDGSLPVEGEQVAALCEELRAGNPDADHHIELQLPGAGMLSCRAQVERGPDGVPQRLIGVVHDVSAERIARFRVERSARRFADLMALVPVGVALLDPAGRVVDANGGMCALLDVPLERLRGTAATALSADDASAGGAVLPDWLRAVPPGAQHGYRVDAAPLRRADGTTVWCELAVSATAADDGGFLWLLTCTDVTDRRRAAELLRSAGMVDELTRLPNRAASLELVERGGIGIATDGVVSSATKALELEAELRAAIATDGLVLDYQPVVGPDGTVISAEALVRWPHPERGLIPPSDFLPVVQRSGLLRELDLWVLRAAAREAAGWPEHRGRRCAVAVNLAGLLPGDAGFVAAVSDTVSDAGLEWDRLVLELVETSLVALPPHALAAMAELTERGVRFAVDDFVTGYSSLARLKELPAQTVKVDRAFVTGVADDPADFAVARAVVDMARAMGRTTVAEGVETAEQFHVLRGIGVDAYQGWLFSRPLRAAGVRDVLAGGRLATPAAAGRARRV
jgi:PAS domain S-box-containing protein